jgi:hypothetical protein
VKVPRTVESVVDGAKSLLLRLPSCRVTEPIGARVGRTFTTSERPIRITSVIATWLILPVVICLSQRLSHACLSTCFNKAKPRMAH